MLHVWGTRNITWKIKAEIVNNFKHWKIVITVNKRSTKRNYYTLKCPTQLSAGYGEEHKLILQEIHQVVHQNVRALLVVVVVCKLKMIHSRRELFEWTQS